MVAISPTPPTATTVPAAAAGPLAAGTVASQLAALATQVGTQTYTADRTLTAVDFGCVLHMNKATAIALTLPQDSALTAPIGTVLEVFQLGAGTVTVQAGTGATLVSANNTTTARALSGKYASAVVRKVAADTWTVAGSLT